MFSYFATHTVYGGTRARPRSAAAGAPVAPAPRLPTGLIPVYFASQRLFLTVQAFTISSPIELQEPALLAAEGPAHGGDQDRIRRLQESGLNCGFHRIPAESPFYVW